MLWQSFHKWALKTRRTSVSNIGGTFHQDIVRIYHSWRGGQCKQLSRTWRLPENSRNLDNSIFLKTLGITLSIPSCWFWWYFPSLCVHFHVYSQVGVSGKRLSTVVASVAPLVPVLLFVVLHFTFLRKPLSTNTAFIFPLPSVPALVDVQLYLRLERLWTIWTRKSFGIRVACQVPCR